MNFFLRLNFFLFIACWSLLSVAAYASGFDDSYEALLATNGDILVRQKPQIIILHGDIATPIVLPPPVEEFVLYPQGVGYSSNTDTSGFNLSGAVQVDIAIGDFNVDGLLDMVLKDIGGNIFDQIVFAENSGIPIQIRTMDDDFQQFADEIFNWLIDTDYFDENADEIEEEEIEYVNQFYWSNTIAGNSAQYAACIASFGIDSCVNLGYQSLDDIFLGECELIGFPSNFPDCDEDWNWVIGIEEITNIVTVLDYSKFNQDARDLADILAGIAEGETTVQEALVFVEQIIGVLVGGTGAGRIPVGDFDEDDAEDGFDIVWTLTSLFNVSRDEGQNEPSQSITVKGGFLLPPFFFTNFDYDGTFHASVHCTVNGVNRWHSAFPSDGFDIDPDEWGYLISIPDRDTDDPDNWYVFTVGTVSKPGTSDENLWTQINSAVNNYESVQTTVPYCVLPDQPLLCTGYNSNGFIRGLLNAVDGTYMNTNFFLDFDSGTAFPGVNQPVPTEKFE